MTGPDTSPSRHSRLLGQLPPRGRLPALALVQPAARWLPELGPADGIPPAQQQDQLAGQADHPSGRAPDDRNRHDVRLDSRRATDPPGGVLGGLSFALDLTEGQPGGHILRTTLIGMAIGERAPRRARAHRPLSRAAAQGHRLHRERVAHERAARRETTRGQACPQAHRSLHPQGPRELGAAGRRPPRAAAHAREDGARPRPRRGTHEALIRLRCERGRELALDLGFPAAVADAIGALDEHWDGGGHPDGIAGEAIPRFSRILLPRPDRRGVRRGARHAGGGRVVRGRSGRWFDPALAPLVDTEVLAAVPRDEALAPRGGRLEPRRGASTDASARRT